MVFSLFFVFFILAQGFSLKMQLFHQKTNCFIMFSFTSVEKTIGFIVCSLKHVEKSLVLLWFRSKILKNHWFYCVFAQKFCKTITFSIKIDKKIAFFVEILVRKWQKRKKVKKTLRFIWKIVKKSNFALFSLCFLLFWASRTALGTRRGLGQLPRLKLSE